jgi:hypothetical protein
MKMKSKTKDINLLNTKPRYFQAILQLFQLVDALIADKRKDIFNDKRFKASRKSFDYVDAITNLMVRSDEVVAAVACTSHPGHHIIFESESPASETLSGGNAHSQVRP